MHQISALFSDIAVLSYFLHELVLSVKSLIHFFKS